VYSQFLFDGLTVKNYNALSILSAHGDWMIRSLESFIEAQSKRAVGACGIALSILLGYLDLISGVEIHLLLLYLIPIFLGSWFVSREMGVYLAFFGSLIWFVVDSLGGRVYSSTWIAYWNLLMRTGVFVIFAVTQAQLRVKLNELSSLAARDMLTGLPNAHAFYELTAKETSRAFGGAPMTLACVDIAGFKWVNHRFGYPTGDQMLCTIAQTIRAHAPRPDLLARTGGTSFSLLLPNTTSEGANAILQQIYKALQEERRKYSHPLTFYVSAIACPKAPKTIAELLHQADVQMDRMRGGKKDSIQIAAAENLTALN
jgi:diguanylate cyclase (GGDEF)-like protein